MSSFDLVQYADKYSGRIKMDRIGFIRNQQPSLPEIDLILRNCAAGFSKPHVIMQRFTSNNFNEDEVFGTDFFRDNPPMVQMRMSFDAGLDSLARRSASQVYQNIMDNKSVSTKERFEALMEASLVTLICDSYTSAANSQQLAECERILTNAEKAAEAAAAVAAKGLSSSVSNDPSVFYPTPTDTLRCRIMRAISSLVNKNPRACANALLHLPQTCIDTPDERICDIATISDLVMYVVLCSLATMTREELRSNVIENANLREWLERSDCSAYKTLLNSFFNCKWSSAWHTLETVMKNARFDMFIERVSGALAENIRERLVLQYCKPYETISFEVMAKAFDVDKFFIERMILDLIDNGTLSARINGVDHTLTKFTPNARTEAFESTIRAGQVFEDWTDRDLFYTNIIDGGFLNAVFEKDMLDGVVEGYDRLRRSGSGVNVSKSHRGARDDMDYDDFMDDPRVEQLTHLINSMGIPERTSPEDLAYMLNANGGSLPPEMVLEVLNKMEQKQDDHNPRQRTRDSDRPPHNSRNGAAAGGRNNAPSGKKHFFW